MADGPTPLYLARRSYRRRRLIDALQLLPFLLFALWVLPLLWGGGDTGRPIGEGSRAFVHVFLVWGLGILGVVFLSRSLKRETELELSERHQIASSSSNEPDT